jgi:hypothetical protein
MNVGGTVIAALLIIELAICGEMLLAVKGRPTVQVTTAPAVLDARVVEGGPHRTFAAGDHPALSVDVGYADLTIVASRDLEIDVSVRPSTSYGVFRAKAPITASADGGTIRIGTAGPHLWTSGDDRMVVVRVPPDTEVTVLEAGDIRANGLRADASLRSIGRGTVTIADYEAPSLQVASSNGPISLRRVAATRLDATSKNDRVDGTDLLVRDGDVESSDGVTLRFATGADTLVTADTANGRVRVSGLTARAAATASDDDSGDASLRTVRVGAGQGRLDVHSTDGNIDLIHAG